MLVVTRRKEEEITIGDPNNPIGKVKIVSIGQGRVRVACDFPKDVEIHRTNNKTPAPPPDTEGGTPT